MLQADVVLEGGGDFITQLSQIAAPVDFLLDAANGRIYAGLETLTDDQWDRIDGLSSKCKGHGRLLKAPEAFAQTNDVFGSSRADWRLSHMIKNALDPEKVFAPGALPGRV